ncbi:proteasome subunit beta [archaeon]|nr:proteasome subunit beta [archaeon]|tara:strand:+ start:2941 stop:3591 length:651 start_codon:yes stop_codon:yes gene_type:complete
MNEEMKNKILKTGTTTVGIVCKDGVILAADRRMSAGYMIAGKKTQKVIPISDEIAVTTAGMVSDAQLLTRIIKAQIRLESIKRGKKLTVKEITSFLGSLVYGNVRKMSMVPGIVGFLVGGVDRKGHHLYALGIDGSIIEYDDYYADGSGIMFSMGVLESQYKKDLTVEEGIKLATKAVNTSIQRDMASGNGIDIIAITSKGMKKVVEKAIDTNVKV